MSYLLSHHGLRKILSLMWQNDKNVTLLTKSETLQLARMFSLVINLLYCLLKIKKKKKKKKKKKEEEEEEEEEKKKLKTIVWYTLKKQTNKKTLFKNEQIPLPRDTHKVFI